MIDRYVYVPSSILTGLSFPLDPSNSIIASREDEALAIAAGIHIGGGQPLVMMQNSGFANSLNTLGSLLMAYSLRVPIVVTLRGGVSDENPAQMPFGRATKQICASLGVPTRHCDDPTKIVGLAHSVTDDRTWATGPLVVLYGARDA
ncbi:hypothetical protein H9651_09670 [Microbacterium sp. Sa4CUA7]|uniref:Thiamine pyrophosphate enzyme N-terminal TPP-binding domain-containing protein n=1 Tax=Microbacterium pullorum TaxID=2762236 RepID=A0ABR8S3D8_9MICO|nr:hypothetical protein [Microbacterium pullorum]MBD7957904.1 hypothetical protein [Microbacterium pullorum]